MSKMNLVEAIIDFENTQLTHKTHDKSVFMQMHWRELVDFVDATSEEFPVSYSQASPSILKTRNALIREQKTTYDVTYGMSHATSDYLF